MPDDDRQDFFVHELAGRFSRQLFFVAQQRIEFEEIYTAKGRHRYLPRHSTGLEPRHPQTREFACDFARSRRCRSSVRAASQYGILNRFLTRSHAGIALTDRPARLRKVKQRAADWLQAWPVPRPSAFPKRAGRYRHVDTSRDIQAN